jgi:hypothetical protein
VLRFSAERTSVAQKQYEMSLFGAKKSVTSLKESLQKAKENMKQMESKSAASGDPVTSSGLNRQLEGITGPPSPSLDPDGTATTSEIAREEVAREYLGTAEYEILKEEDKQQAFEHGRHKARIEDDLRRRENSQATSRIGTGQLPSDLDDMRAYSDLTGKTGVAGITRYRETEDEDENGMSDSTLSPLPTTSYGGSIAAVPSSAIHQDPFLTLRVSATQGIVGRKYILMEERASMEEEKEQGVQESPKRGRTLAFEKSSSHDVMTEVEWRQEEPYMMPTKIGKLRNEGNGTMEGK